MSFRDIIKGAKRVAVTEKDDLVINIARGIAYQADKDNLIEYGKEYLQHYIDLEKSKTCHNINERRKDLVYNTCPYGKILDYGSGAGTFLKKIAGRGYGYDINPYAVTKLKDDRVYVDPYENIPNDVTCFTFWDSLEHIPQPGSILAKVKSHCYVYVSIPIIDDISKVKQWKHYKPNEHLWYFTRKGFTNWMRNFDLVPWSAALDFEIKEGRQDIYTFVFKRI